MSTRLLVDNVPNQLTDLAIKISDQNIFNWIDIVGMELALRLMEKAGSIEKNFIRFGDSEEYQVQANNESNMTKYFKLLNSFRRTRQTLCIAIFNDPVSKTSASGYSFKYDVFNRLFVTYGLYRNDLYESNYANMAVPDKTSSIIGLEIFHALEFNLLGLYDDDDDIYRVLNYSLPNCPRLQSLNIMFNDSIFLKSSLSLRHKEGKISSDQANGDINFLQMEIIRPSKDLVDLVTTHLHNIEIVSLNAKGWSRRYNGPVIDLTGLKKLKSLIYTTADNCSAKENKFGLIQYINETEQHVLEYEKKKGRGHLSSIIRCDVSVSIDFR
ncbi:hypothetical protein HPULCUR_010799 [Helicostylum pulchrum]|uniref:Uncharacterized protein n=1 Tax=Helicostylum pulchrum TaxID=562976 RepID=A0ABP9YEA5_9FUNG